MNNRKNLTILCVTMIFLLVIIMIFQFVTLTVETQKQETLIAEIAEMEKAIDDIEDEIDYRETLLYIEKYARENLELYGDNDIIFVPNE